MAGFVKGDVVVLPFPFSDLTQSKRRPALVLVALNGSEVLLCQITSQNVRDGHAIVLEAADFHSGALKKPSNIRPNHVFTADSRIILYRVGQLREQKTSDVVDELIKILRQ